MEKFFNDHGTSSVLCLISLVITSIGYHESHLYLLLFQFGMLVFLVYKANTERVGSNSSLLVMFFSLALTIMPIWPPNTFMLVIGVIDICLLMAIRYFAKKEKSTALTS